MPPISRRRFASTRSRAVTAGLPPRAPRAARSPAAAAERVVKAIAAHHATAPERVVLGCGSSEVLRLCDAAFLGPGRTVMAAASTFEGVLSHARVTRARERESPVADRK